MAHRRPESAVPPAHPGGVVGAAATALGAMFDVDVIDAVVEAEVIDALATPGVAVALAELAGEVTCTLALFGVAGGATATGVGEPNMPAKPGMRSRNAYAVPTKPSTRIAAIAQGNAELRCDDCVERSSTD